MPVELVINLDVSVDTLKMRMLKRSVKTRRVDDTEEVVTKRIETYVESIKSVLKLYSTMDKLRTVSILDLL